MSARRYLTDDCDQERVELVVDRGGNGDWYVSILPEGDKIGPTVRLTTSGARRQHQGVAMAVYRLWRALGGEEPSSLLGPQPSVLEWLHAPWDGALPWDELFGLVVPGVAREALTRLHVWAALVGANGGPIVRGWGCMGHGGPYGRTGLDEREAFCLMDLSAFVRGWCAGTNSDAAVFEALKREIDRARAVAASASETPAEVAP